MYILALLLDWDIVLVEFLLIIIIVVVVVVLDGDMFSNVFEGAGFHEI